VGRDRWSAIGLALLAIGYLLAGRRYPLDTLATPGPGVVPVVAGLALLGAAISLFVVAGSARPARSVGGLIETGVAPERPIEPSETDGVPSRPINGSALVLAAALVLYAAVLPRLGFLASSFVLVVVASRLMGAAGWWRPVALAVGVTGASYLLFARWLGVPLP
jgi:hypothetical protein